jgi:hypothetical protein
MDRFGTDPHGGPWPETDEAIGALLRLAGPRIPMPQDSARRVKAAVHAVWERKVRARRLRVAFMWTGVMATAASVSFLLLSRPWTQEVARPPETVARLERLTGVIRGIGPDRQEPAPLSLGAAVVAGATLETASQGRAALRLASGGSLRLDMNTRLKLVSPTEISLERGALYLDSDRKPSERPSMEVSTPHGVVREVGTQFEVQVASGVVRVRVREGRIALERRDGAHEATAGEQLAVQENQVARSRVPPHGPHWDWVQRIAPRFELEGESLAGFLDWVSRETGRPIRFDDDRLADESPDVKLHGSIEGLRPEEALAAVLPTCGFVHRFSEGAVIVGRARDGSEPKG